MRIIFPDIGNSIFLYSDLPIYVNVNECLTSVKWIFYIGKSIWLNPEYSNGQNLPAWISWIVAKANYLWWFNDIGKLFTHISYQICRYQ